MKTYFFFNVLLDKNHYSVILFLEHQFIILYLRIIMIIGHHIHLHNLPINETYENEKCLLYYYFLLYK